jgi:signal transduction histidine kinase
MREVGFILSSTTKNFENIIMDKVKLLIVDDSELTLTKIGSFLAADNVEIYTSTSGREALLDIEKNDFALFIIDVHMKDMDGHELAVEIKKIEKELSTPIIFITAQHIDKAREFKGYDIGCIDYISKSDDLAILKNKAGLFVQMAINQQKLKYLNADLEESNKRLNDFVAIVAHDLRNPIGAIMGYVSILSQIRLGEENCGTKERKILTQLGKLGELSIALIRDILEIGALGSGKLEINKKIEDLRGIIDESIENVKFLAQKKSIDLKNDEPKNVNLEVDKVRIIQVITNLLTNAIKFTPQGGRVELVISEDQKNKGIVVEVKDNGTGIPEAILKNLFDKEVTTTTNGTDGEKGTGFGLPLCQDLIKAHESEIFVETSDDGGSKFFFKLQK